MCVIRSPTTKGWPLALGRMNEFDEAAAEHERLELQGGVEDPEQAQDDLEHPLGADGQREAARRRPAPGSSRSLVHALTYATGGLRDGRVRAAGVWARPSGQLEVLGDAVVGVTASATALPFTLSYTLSAAPLRHEYAGTLDWKLVSVPAGTTPSTWLEATGVSATVAPL